MGNGPSRGLSDEIESLQEEVNRLREQAQRAAEERRAAEEEAARLQQEASDAQQQVNELSEEVERLSIISQNGAMAPVVGPAPVPAPVPTPPPASQPAPKPAPVPAPVPEPLPDPVPGPNPNQPTDESEDEPPEPPAPNPPARPPGIFGAWPHPMTGGNNNYMQFRSHFRVFTASLYRKLHDRRDNRRVSVTDLSRLEGMLWLAVKAYCAELLMNEHNARVALGQDSVLADAADINDLTTAKAAIDAAKQSIALRRVPNMAVRVETPEHLARLMKAMHELRERAAHFVADSAEQAERQRLAAAGATDVNLSTSEARVQARETLHQVEEQEVTVARLESTADALRSQIRGQETLFRIKMEHLGQLETHLARLQQQGRREEAAVVEAQIYEVNDSVVHLLAELDALEADWQEAARAAKETRGQLDLLQDASNRLHSRVHHDQPGTSASHARQARMALESQLRQARNKLVVLQLETERRRQNIERMRASVETMRAEYNRQLQAMYSLPVLPIPQNSEEGLRATREALNAADTLRRDADVIHGALTTLEQELQTEQAAAEAGAQEQLQLRRQISELEAQVAQTQEDAPRMAPL